MAHVDRCRNVVSSWVLRIAEVGGQLAIQFKKHGVWCLYPGTSPAWFDLMAAAPSKGHFVHLYLYKKWPYHLIATPAACLAQQTCNNCIDPMPIQLALTAEGFANGTCTGCTLLNGIWTVAYDPVASAVYAPGTCVWTGPYVDYCPSHQAARWWLYRGASNQFSLQLQGEQNQQSYWTGYAPTPANDCSLPLTFTYSGGSDCASYPNTITVAAA